MDQELPWNKKPLDEWDIVGMNHYHIKGEKYLFCAMTKDKNKKCIKEEGKNEREVFKELREKARKEKVYNK